jgi:hypothetical protein
VELAVVLAAIWEEAWVEEVAVVLAAIWEEAWVEEWEATLEVNQFFLFSSFILNLPCMFCFRRHDWWRWNGW